METLISNLKEQLCEALSLEDIKPEENKELNELVEIARHTVKAFRKNHKKIKNVIENLKNM